MYIASYFGHILLLCNSNLNYDDGYSGLLFSLSNIQRIINVINKLPTHHIFYEQCNQCRSDMITAILHRIINNNSKTDYLKVIRIVLLKLVNSSMENINQILKKNNWNLQSSPGDRHCSLFS